MANERITEDMVREWLKNDELFKNESSNIKIEEQKSKNPMIQKLLQHASKSGGKGLGQPEFLVHGFNAPYHDLLIVVECKADIKDHESKTGDQFSKYAVDGVKLYASYLSKEYDVIAIAVSGEKLDHLKVSHFLQLKGQSECKQILGNELISLTSCIESYIHDEEKSRQDYQTLLDYAPILNTQLHNINVREGERALLVSGILIALKNTKFRASYKHIQASPEQLKHDPQILGKELTKDLVDAISSQLSVGSLGAKAETIANSYSFIKTHEAWLKDHKILENLITEIDTKTSSFVITQKYHDILGSFYKEFLKYANMDNSLGIVLTPSHITEFFTDIVKLTKDDVVYDSCCGTGGFLLASMRKLLSTTDSIEEQKRIKKECLIGVEISPPFFSLAVSNMFMNGDGKTSIMLGNCLDNETKSYVKTKKPTIGFLNPPYSQGTNELEFIYHNMECLQKNSLCVAIIPTSCVLSNRGHDVIWKEKLMSKHTVKAVFSMPNQLFHGKSKSGVGVIASIIVLKAFTPHDSNKKTFFGYFKDDGFEVKRHGGRIEKYENAWKETENKILNLYHNNQELEGFSVLQSVVYSDEWCAESYMKTDYSQLTQEMFEKTLIKYTAFKLGK